MAFKLLVQSVFNYYFYCTKDFLLRLDFYFPDYCRSKNSFVMKLIYDQYFKGAKLQQISLKSKGAHLNNTFF